MRTPRPVPSSLLRFSPLVAALAPLLVAPAFAGTYVVNDSGNTTGATVPANCATGSTCSLHQAIQSAMSLCDTNAIIQFNLPSPFTISPSFPLPSVADCDGINVKVTIDGYSQATAAPNTAPQGFDGNVVVIIDGTFFSTFSCALQTSNFGYGEGGLALKGLDVRNFNYGGIPPICGAVEVTGSKVQNNSYGIDVKEPGFVGGVAAADRNVISGNFNTGVNAYFGQVHIINNLVGTNDAGTAGAGNFLGITMNSQGASGSSILNNVVSGNGSTGIEVVDSPDIAISGNSVGTDVTRMVAIGNGGGITVQCSPNATLANNNISGNQYGGMFMSGTDGANLSGNYIGMAADGATALPNDGHGLELSNSGFCGAAMKSPILFGTNSSNLSGNVIANNNGDGILINGGGDNSLVSNTIKLNTGNGVRIVQGTGNEISGNSIYGNTLKNIDLDFMYGGLPNDAGDVDTGPNERLNHPVISLVTQSGGNTTVAYSYNGLAAARPYNVEFYANLAAGVPAGKTLVATVPFATDATGNISTSAVLTGAWDNVSALAIDQTTLDTSEFSPAVALTPTPEVAMTPPSPATLNFANTVVGASSGTQSVTLTSVGTANYVINAFADGASCYGGPICSSGAFICANSCSTGTPYAPSSSCSISITFSPSVLGPTSETFSICDNAAGTPRSVTLTGTGIAPPPPTVAPTSHSFGSIQVDAFSAPHTFTFTNPAPISVTISSATISGPFQIVSNGCVGSVSYGGNCTIDARFAPFASGPASGNLTVVMSSGTATSALSGTGTPTPPATMTPPSHDFGTVVVGSPSAAGTFTISNPAATPMALSAFTVTPPFQLLSTTCTDPMPPASTCQALVKFVPSAVGPASGTISATAGFGTISSGLVGNGAVSASLQVAPTGYDFGTVLVGSSASKAFTFTNPATTPVTLSAPSVSSPFQISSTTCTSSLPPSGTCIANVRFVPTTNSTVSGTLSVASSAGTATAALVGTGRLQPVLTMPSGLIDLGTLTLGSAPGARQVTLTNSGNAALTIDSISIGLPFTLTHDCPSSLPAGDSCVVTIELNPTALGTFTGSLSVLTNAPGGSRSVQVRGQVQPRPEPVIRVSPLSIGFGERMVGTQTPDRRITVSNEGGSDALALNLSINTPHFLIVNTTCGNVLAPQSTCFADVAFQPSGFGAKRATLNVTSTAPTARVGLSGAGCRPPQASMGRSTRLNCGP